MNKESSGLKFEKSLVHLPIATDILVTSSCRATFTLPSRLSLFAQMKSRKTLALDSIGGTKEERELRAFCLLCLLFLIGSCDGELDCDQNLVLVHRQWTGLVLFFPLLSSFSSLLFFIIIHPWSPNHISHSPHHHRAHYIFSCVVPFF